MTNTKFKKIEEKNNLNIIKEDSINNINNEVIKNLFNKDFDKIPTSYCNIYNTCYNIFINKQKDYGNSFKSIELSTITDLILIKANRVKTILKKKDQKIDDPIIGELYGIINYSILYLSKYINSKLDDGQPQNSNHYNYLREAYKLLEAKNHDYGEIWQDMRLLSIIDIILIRIYRIQNIEDNNYEIKSSEDISSNLYDIINYCCFSYFKLNKND